VREREDEGERREFRVARDGDKVGCWSARGGATHTQKAPPAGHAGKSILVAHSDGLRGHKAIKWPELKVISVMLKSSNYSLLPQIFLKNTTFRTFILIQNELCYLIEENESKGSSGGVGIWIQSAATERRSTVICSTCASFWPIAQLEEEKHCMGPIKTVSARETEAHVTISSQTTFYFAKKKHLKTSLFTQTPLKF
jgi:hypothetical protein